MTKTLDQHFIDWESDALGFGYGSGEPHIVPALKAFMAAIPDNGDGNTNYDYMVLERAVGPSVAWLLINLFGHADVIEYGTSPRFGWLTPHGAQLKRYIDERTADEILAVLNHDDEYVSCLRNYCNCGEATPCVNPFWPIRRDPIEGRDAP